MKRSKKKTMIKRIFSVGIAVLTAASTGGLSVFAAADTNNGSKNDYVYNIAENQSVYTRNSDNALGIAETVSAQLKNDSTVSAASVELGKTVTVTAKASGGTGAYTYAAYYKKSSSSSWTTIRDYGETSVMKIKPAAAVSYDIRVKVKDSSGKIVSKDFKLNVTKILANNSTISAASVELGKTVTVTAKASGGTGAYTYAAYYKKSSSSSWTTIRDYGETSVMKIKPAAAVSYDIRVKVKDSSGKIVSKDFKLNVTKALANNSTISSTSVELGKTVKITAKASGGTGSYMYAAYYKKSTSSSWTRIRDYGNTAEMTVKPAAAVSYDIRVKVKDSSGKVVNKDIKLNVTKVLVNDSVINSTSVELGETVKITAKASGGTGSYMYAAYYKKSSSSSWTRIRDYGKTAEMTVKPAAAVSYDIRVKVKDSNGKVVNKDFKVNVKKSGIVNNSVISTEKAEPNEKIVITLDSSGGNGSVTYEYGYRDSLNKNWQKVGTGSAGFVKLVMSFGEEGKYYIYVDMTDSSGNTDKKIFTVDVVDSKLSAEVDKILDGIITENMSEYDKVKAIHDWLVCNVEYDVEGYYGGNIPYTDYTIEGLLSTRKAVCDGYAKTFKKMAIQAGLEAVRITGNGKSGNSSEGHAWNQVKVDGKWYNVDVTWDDPIMSGVTDNRNLTYRYFLIPDSLMNVDHFSDKNSEGYLHECTSEQPVQKIAESEIAKDTAENKNCIYADTSTLKSGIQSMYDKGVTEFDVIYYKPGTQRDNIGKDFFAYIPPGHGMSLRMSDWKLSDYYYVHVTIK